MKHNNDDYDFDRRASLMHSDKIGTMDIPWTEELAGPGGMHFHVWIPKVGTENEKALLDRFKSATRRQRDVVSFSWDYIPEEHVTTVFKPLLAEHDREIMFETSSYVIFKPLTERRL